MGSGSGSQSRLLLGRGLQRRFILLSANNLHLGQPPSDSWQAELVQTLRNSALGHWSDVPAARLSPVSLGHSLVGAAHPVLTPDAEA